MYARGYYLRNLKYKNRINRIFVQLHSQIGQSNRNYYSDVSIWNVGGAGYLYHSFEIDL